MFWQTTVPDLIFNNAYIPVLGGVEDIVMDDWRLALEVNVLGYVRIIKAFVAPMIKRGSGHIMNTASPMGIMPDLFDAGHMMPYCASKAADIGLSSSLAAALYPHGIGVSVFFLTSPTLGPTRQEAQSVRSLPTRSAS